MLKFRCCFLITIVLLVIRYRYFRFNHRNNYTVQLNHQVEYYRYFEITVHDYVIILCYRHARLPCVVWAEFRSFSHFEVLVLSAWAISAACPGTTAKPPAAAVRRALSDCSVIDRSICRLRRRHLQRSRFAEKKKNNKNANEKKCREKCVKFFFIFFYTKFSRRSAVQ